MTDARPFRPSAQSAWDRAVEDRAHIETVLQETLRAEGVEAAVIPSEDGIYPPYVRVQAWMADRPTDRRQTLRSVVDFVVEAKPYHHAPVVRTMKLTYGPKKLELKQRPNLGDADVAAWTRHALGRAPRPSSYKPWRDALLAVAATFHLARAPHVNKLEKRFRPSRFTAEAVTLGLALLCLYAAVQFASSYDGAGAAAFLAILAVVLFAATFLLRRWRIEAIAVPSQPTATSPRRLIPVDEWHAIATGLSEWTADFEASVARAIQASAASAEFGMTYMRETVHHLTPNGYEARPRLVLQRGQSEVHLDIYGFGDDLFVGWNAYLNWLQWAEGKPVSTRTSGGVATRFHALEPGFYIPTQLDLIDLNCLTELVHRSVKKELDALVKAGCIEQQIDFEIFRGNRDQALDRRRHGTNAKERGEDTWDRIMKSYAAFQGAADTGAQRQATSKPERPAAAGSGRSGLVSAAFAVVTWWILGLLLEPFMRDSAFRLELGRGEIFFFVSFLAGVLAIAVAARIFARLSTAQCLAIGVGAYVLEFAAFLVSTMTVNVLSLDTYDTRMIAGAVFSLGYMLARLAALMVFLPAYRRRGVVLLCCAYACLTPSLSRYIFELMHDRSYALGAFYGVPLALPGALSIALLAYWLPERETQVIL